MALKLNLTKDFIETTDMMIKTLKKKKVSFENMNFMVVKIPTKDKSDTIITISGLDEKRRESYKSGIARVVSVPRLIDNATDASPAVGDYVVYGHGAEYTLYETVVNYLFDVEMDFSGEAKSPISLIRDVDIFAVLKQDVVQDKVV